MKTSRIARETARVSKNSTSSDCVPKRLTRSFAASLNAFVANDGSAQGDSFDVKQDDVSDSDSSLSSAHSVKSFDIEDAVIKASSTGKRKRDPGTPSATVSTISATTSTRISPRKASAGVIVKKAKHQPAKQTINDAGEVEVHPPANWQEIYDAVKEMRKTVLAPVDTMGCETLAEEHLTPRDKRFQTLVALMLSSQTKDTTNAIAMRRLQTELPSPGLTLENILKIDPVRLNEMIYVVGFHNNKTKYIKAASLILREQFNGDIPDTIEGLMSLPGVGPKMAYLCMSAAWGRHEGIGVDVHVHRITNLWSWHKTKSPEETRAALEAWLPQNKWHEINHLLVGFGQTICLPVGRKCGQCTLSGSGLCPSAVVEKKRTVKRVKKEVSKDSHKREMDVKVEESISIKEEAKTAETS